VNRDFFRALRDRGVGLGSGGGGFGGGAELADPGQYTIVLKLGDRTLTTELQVIRREGYSSIP
jgi:hypothetical protein